MCQSQTNTPKWWKVIASSLTIGFGVGWLTGLSASAVLSTVLSSMLAIISGAVATFAVAKRKSAVSIDSGLVPIAALVLGITIGSSFGIVVRTHQWLEPTIEQQVARWSATELSQKAIAQRLLDQEVPVSGKVSTPSFKSGVLFSLPADECARLQAATNDRLNAMMSGSTQEEVRRAAASAPDPEALRLWVNRICK